MYKIDILQEHFEQQTLLLKKDYEGKAVSTLIRRISENNSNKAVLYIHGFNDYFFQKEMAFQFNEQGYNFYALDLRKYGRSYLNHQKLNDIRNLKDYFEEIFKALFIIKEERNRHIYLMGHSTGGLILTLFAKRYTKKELFCGLILNSPFFEFNQPYFIKSLIPLSAWLGKFLPRIKVSGGCFSQEYGKYLHESFEGEWDYNLEWKPNIPPKVNLGWIRAIWEGQKKLKRHFKIYEPILLLHSQKSVTNLNDKNQIQTRDAILNIDDIKQIASNIHGDREIVSIKDGIHDLILSKQDVRTYVYLIIFDWLKRKQPVKT